MQREVDGMTMGRGWMIVEGRGLTQFKRGLNVCYLGPVPDLFQNLLTTTAEQAQAALFSNSS